MSAMTELEERLAGPEGSKVRSELVNELAQIELRLRRSIMLPRTEYLQVSGLADAVQAAQEVLNAWPVGTSQPSKMAGPAQVKRF